MEKRSTWLIVGASYETRILCTVWLKYTICRWYEYTNRRVSFWIEILLVDAIHQIQLDQMNQR